VTILFIAAAGLTFALGVAWLFAPLTMLMAWGAKPDEAAVYMARRYGGLFLGYAVILWLARHAEASPVRDAILLGGGVVSTALMVVSLFGIATGVVGRVVWTAVLIEGALAAAFFYFLSTGRS
jgi:hypothetical protein